MQAPDDPMGGDAPANAGIPLEVPSDAAPHRDSTVFPTFEDRFGRGPVTAEMVRDAWN
jgi:hypothetical protein